MAKSDGIKKIHISFSEFSKYMECPHRHLIENYLKIEKQPPSIHLFFGSAIHEAIEFGLSRNLNLDQRIAHFKKYFHGEMDAKLKDNKDYKQVANFTAQGEHILRNILTESIIKKYEIVGVEEQLYENVFGLYHFKGFIDFIARDRKTGKIIIIDWKTSGEAWDVKKKVSDVIFASQMRFYKYFYARKHNLDFDSIECKYVVLNRLKNKRNPYQGFGELQSVPMNFTYADIDESVTRLITAIKDIHIKKSFPKAKLNDKRSNCYWCPYKEGHPLCNNDDMQYKEILEEHKDKNPS